jgi:hypothetical protein
MYAAQIQLLDKLAEFLPAEAVDILKAVLCNPQQTLDHRGALDLNVDGMQRAVPNRRIETKLNDDAGAFGTVMVSNPSSKLVYGDHGAIEVENGAAGWVQGVLVTVANDFNNPAVTIDGPNPLASISHYATGIRVEERLMLGDNVVWTVGEGWTGTAAQQIGKVRVREDEDDALEFLKFKFSNVVASGAYVADQDMLVKFEEVDDTTTNDRWYLRGHIDVSSIPGWDADVVQVLGHNADGELTWYDTDEC